jgi:putative ABC transport system permease protein
MHWIAWRMLTGSRTKYLVMLFGLTFSSLLVAQQCSIFCGVLRMTAGQILDVKDADVWVIDPEARYIEDLRPLGEHRLHEVRSVRGVAWAVGWRRGITRVNLPGGRFQQVILQGLDDDTLVGAPRTLLCGQPQDMYRADAVLIDEVGCQLLWPGQDLPLGRSLTINGTRAVVVGVCRVSLTFQTLPVVYARASLAARFLPPERQLLSAVLVRPRPGTAAAELCARIRQSTGLLALTRNEFCWRTVEHYLRHTGLLANFGTTVLLGFLVGVAVAGQTFYTFVIENLPYFALLKAMGTSNARLRGVVLLQASLVSAVGYGLGVGLAAAFGEMTRGHSKLVFYMPWQVLVVTGLSVLLITTLASLLAVVRVTRVEPALTVRGDL